MRVLSLFDGISCGKVALDRAGIPYTEYAASEVDKYAIKISEANHKDIIQLGDVREVKNHECDLLIGGSPCQGFSFAGKQLNFDDPRSALFFEYVRILKESRPRYFLLENVCMKKEIENHISELLGVSPILINSNLMSAQNRKRLYWTNIPNVTQPEDKGITWGDIREYDNGQLAPNIYYTEKGKAWIQRHIDRTGKGLRVWKDTDKVQMIEASHHKGYSSQRFFGIVDTLGMRYITPLECERCQTLPDNYTNHVSNTQRYRAIGNGWTVDVIAHILRGIK